jgi:Protein of unknown function (DUF3307)
MQSAQMTFLALLLAHLLADFPFQSERIARNKGKQLPLLALHGILHLALSWACLLIFTPIHFLSLSSHAVVTGTVAVHLLVDQLRHRLVAARILLDSWRTFLLDQFFHLIAITIAVALLNRIPIGTIVQSLQFSPSTKTHILEIATVYVAVIFGGGYLIRYLTAGLAKNAVPSPHAHIGNAGLYVGWIERFLVITAIIMQSPTLVGLILTGKSIARFPEFKEARFAEYFLIGTLLSISLSVVGGIVLLYLIYGTVSLK